VSPASVALLLESGACSFASFAPSREPGLGSAAVGSGLGVNGAAVGTKGGKRSGHRIATRVIHAKARSREVMMVVGDALDALLEGAREWLDDLLVFASFAPSREPGLGSAAVGSGLGVNGAAVGTKGGKRSGRRIATRVVHAKARSREVMMVVGDVSPPACRPVHRKF